MTDGRVPAIDRIHAAGAGGLSSAEYISLSRQLEESREALHPIRLVLLSTFTTELFAPYLRVEGARNGFWIDLHEGGFGQLELALGSDAMPAPDDVTEVLALCVRLEDLDPDYPARYYSPGSDFDATCRDALSRIDATLDIFRGRTSGPALVANFAVPEPVPLGIFDAGDPDSLTHRVHALNRSMLKALSAYPDTYVWDYAGLVHSRGSLTWQDPRLWSLARVPVAATHHAHLATHLLRSASGVLRPSAKCLVVDLDGTLWGGIVGDDGLRGLQLGADHPGAAFSRFQRALLGLRDRGILLAVSSKNDEEVARTAIESHPEMLLRWDDFSAHRINWRPKSQNLREIAEELNIGLDSLAFFDDSPLERAEVRHAAPEVYVIDMPADPTRYVEALAATSVFDTATITTEDRQRAEFYLDQSRRAAARSRSPDGFLATLGMKARIGRLDDTTSQRVSQLVAKTNQFNLTTKRYSQAELEELADAEASDVFWLRLSDRYGDLGLIAVAVLSFEGAACVIDSLVLSCRAASRGVEQALVWYLSGIARGRGCGELVGVYKPTPRNHVVADLFSQLGFSPQGDEAQTKFFRMDLSGLSLEPPEHIHIEQNSEGR